MIVIHNTSKLLLEIKFFRQYKVIHTRLGSKALHTLVQPSCEIHMDITDTGQWAWPAVLHLFFLFPHPETPSIAQCSHNLILKAIGNRTLADSTPSDCSGLYKSQASSPLWSRKLTCKHRVTSLLEIAHFSWHSSLWQATLFFHICFPVILRQTRNCTKLGWKLQSKYVNRRTGHCNSYVLPYTPPRLLGMRDGQRRHHCQRKTKVWKETISRKQLLQALIYTKGHQQFISPPYISPLDNQRVNARQTSRKLASQHAKCFEKSREANMLLFTIFCDPNLLIMFYYFLIL